MAKDVMISSVGPGGERTPVSIHRMNGKIKTIWKKGGKSKRRKKTKVTVYKVETMAGPIWRTAISEGGITKTYDTRGSGKQTRRLEIKAGSLYSPGVKKLMERHGYVGEHAIPDAFYYDTTKASRMSGQYLDKPITIRKTTKTFYDKAAAQAFRKAHYEESLGLYEADLKLFQTPFKGNIQRRSRPMGLRSQARTSRGTQRTSGIQSRASARFSSQRKAKLASKEAQYRRSQLKAGFQRWKKDLESYRDTWGL